MLNNTKHLYEDTKAEDIKGDELDFAYIGQDLIESEELTNKVYETFLAMMVKGWRSSDELTTKKEFNISDIGLVYKIGPYVPCVKRVAYTHSVDLLPDGLPGIRVTANVLPGDISVSLIRPSKLPHHVCFFERPMKTYKHIAFYGGKYGEMETWLLYFGISKKGEILSPINKQRMPDRPWMMHGAQQLYPALAMNAWSDSRYLWLANTSEDIGHGSDHPLKLRLGLNKEHIKSLFYARTLPVTETGRKRPILHWVRAHQRRIKEGIDVDVTAHLRGIENFEMDGLNFSITQPNKAVMHGAEPETVNAAFRMYAGGHNA